MLRIDYESEGFPVGGPVVNGFDVLHTSWDELLWAAVTVGRPNRQYVFQHGNTSVYEALFRWSLVRMALEQSGPTASRLRRTTAAKTLDPSEKGAVNYFLGLTICKLFADRLLQAPWMLHLDVFRPQLNPVLRGRSRPDLVGQTVSGDWVALECKGRVTEPNAQAKDKAKEQAERLVRVNGTVPAFNAGGIAYFRHDVLNFFWRDPTPEPNQVKNPIAVEVPAEAWAYYYTPVLELIRSQPTFPRQMLLQQTLFSVEQLDLKVGIHPDVLRLINAGQWSEARRIAESVARDQSQGIIYRPDGIGIVAGPSWSLPFKDGGSGET